MSSPLYLAIDQGTHASRALVVDRAGRISNRRVEVRDLGGCVLSK